MTNQTRKVDMVLALVEAFTNIVYSPLNKENINATVVPALKYVYISTCYYNFVISFRYLQMFGKCCNRQPVFDPASRNRSSYDQRM